MIALGDKIPEFTLQDQFEKPFSSESLIGVAPLIVYFYPKDFTPGCTMQACNFRDSMEEFKELGVEVVGISSDSTNSHQKFSNRLQLNFRILSDPANKVLRKFGVKSNLFGILPGRETFVFDKEGILVHRFRSIQATSHKKEVLNYLKNR